MKRYYLRVRAESPLSITGHQNVAGQANPTLDHIPGPTLRGAVAWQWVREDPAANQSEPFRWLFDEGAVRWGPLYPLREPVSRAGRTYEADLAFPLPLTARTCKREPGFRHVPPPDEPGHGVTDTLIGAIEEQEIARRERAGEALPERPQGLRRYEECRVGGCGAPLDRLGGFYSSATVGGEPYYWRVHPAARLFTRTRMMDELETARPGALFSRVALEAGQRFAGVLYVAEEAAALLEARLLPGGAPGELYVGAARTAGLGRLRVDPLSGERDPAAAILGSPEQRQAAFEARLPAWLRERWALVPLTLLTDTILLDRFLRFAAALEPELLREYAALDARAAGSAAPALSWPPGATLLLSVARPARVAGWNTAERARRPRHDDLAIGAGSVFVLAAPVVERDALLAACAGLEAAGLGERRDEGFGRLVVAHPFHTEVDRNAQPAND